MKTLLKFFLSYGIYFIFGLLELLSLLLVVNNNHFQHSVYLSSCNKFTAKVYAYNHAVIDYFSLRQVNEELATENALLKNRLILAENKLEGIKQDSLSLSTLKISPEKEYSCFNAKIINNSTNKYLNYITLNKGRRDGIRVEMTVVSAQGVVGIVKAVSEHFSVVMPLLNRKAQISCKLKSKFKTASDSVGAVKDIGSLKWDGVNPMYANMLQVPRHVQIRKGDTIVTSGYSDFFPEGILVGTVESFTNASDDNYYEIKVRLSVNFKTVSFVKVLDYKHRREQSKIQQVAAE